MPLQDHTSTFLKPVLPNNVAKSTWCTWIVIWILCATVFPYTTAQLLFLSHTKCLHVYSAKFPNSKSESSIRLTLLTWVTTASTTSPLKGRNTMALYLTGYKTKPLPGWITPAPMLSMVVTAITNPYLGRTHSKCFNGQITSQHKPWRYTENVAAMPVGWCTSSE